MANVPSLSLSEPRHQQGCSLLGCYAQRRHLCFHLSTAVCRSPKEYLARTSYSCPARLSGHRHRLDTHRLGCSDHHGRGKELRHHHQQPQTDSCKGKESQMADVQVWQDSEQRYHGENWCRLTYYRFIQVYRRKQAPRINRRACHQSLKSMIK